MTDRELSGLHTPQQRPEQEPRSDPNPPQDRGESNEFLDQLAGQNTDQTAYFDDEDIEPLEGITTTDIYEGVTDINQELQEGGAEQLDLLVEQELRAGETDDVMEAIQEGYTYVPPIDPPVTPDADTRESVSVAAGFAFSTDERYEPDSLDQDDTERWQKGLPAVRVYQEPHYGSVSGYHKEVDGCPLDAGPNSTQRHRLHRAV